MGSNSIVRVRWLQGLCSIKGYSHSHAACKQIKMGYIVTYVLNVLKSKWNQAVKVVFRRQSRYQGETSIDQRSLFECPKIKHSIKLIFTNQQS